LSSEREHRGRDCGRYGRNAWFTDASGRSGAFHEINGYMPGRFVDPYDAFPAAEVVLLDRAALHRDAAAERQAHPENHRAFELGTHTVAIDDRGGVE
jgi:hypothetical protein